MSLEAFRQGLNKIRVLERKDDFGVVVVSHRILHGRAYE